GRGSNAPARAPKTTDQAARSVPRRGYRTLPCARRSARYAPRRWRFSAPGPLARRSIAAGRSPQRKCRDGGVLDRIAADGNAVVLEHECEAVADGVATHAAALRRVDLPVEIQDGHLRREDRTAVADG